MVSIPRELEPYRVDHLFLLIGLNPLPNYVVSNLLLKPTASLYLIHSEGPRGTGRVAQRLASHFAHYRPQLIPVDVYNPNRLRQEITRHVSSARGSIGLNYTGGTKVMAIHAYQAVDEACKGRGIDPIFSYLDADRLELIVEPRPGKPPFARKVVNDIEVDFKTLFRLHGLEMRVESQANPQLPNLAQALASLFTTPDGVEAWKEGRKVFQTWERRCWAEVKDELHRVGVVPAVTQQLEQGLAFADTTPMMLDPAARKAGFKNRLDLLGWLNGTWLEDWAWSCLRGLGYRHTARGLKGYAGGKVASPSGRNQKGEREIDVAVLQGYQLFVLTGTIGSELEKQKVKLIEAYTRARQIGGDEARVGLVCPTDDPGGLEQEIAGDWEAATADNSNPSVFNNRVRVFGAKHLVDLQQHLKEWLESV